MPPRNKGNARKNQFKFLLNRANDLGATATKIIPAGKIVVEDRVLLKCKSGCHMYAHKLVCPPFTPAPDEFRKIRNRIDCAPRFTPYSVICEAQYTPALIIPKDTFQKTQ